MGNRDMKKIIEFLEKLIKNQIIIQQTGFISNQIGIQKPMYTIEYDILKIQDIQKENYVHINLNQVYQMDIKEREICLKLDNDTQIKIKDDISK